jgi:hypothetical protein
VPQHALESQASSHPNSVGSAEGIVADYTDIAVRGSVDNVRNLVTQAFAANGFQATWASATKGKAEKGSKGMNIAFGALAQYYAVEFEIFPAPDGSVLRLYQSVSGWWGGMWGRMKVKNQWKLLTGTLASWFQQQGVLVGVREAKA